ncbi:murinoglobulin-2-like isoform X2 [Panulirus ornatus]|uniref:murinoglobulin-2-like isoform X2 n=1 Tax=Panulirus ornatus TaxID=150431 RepID=UPI003A8B8C39
MADPGSLLLSCLLALTVSLSLGGYVITTPRRWIADSPAQVCVFVTNPESPRGYLTVSVISTDRQGDEAKNVTIVPSTTMKIPPGKFQFCFQVSVPNTTYRFCRLHVFGTVDRTRIDRIESLSMKVYTKTTFLQTDKYLYQPGQNVKFRILTLAGYDARVSTKGYPEVWVTTPSRTRIAQWKNVDNSAGLVHLDFNLANEPEKGIYRIHVKTSEGTTKIKNFKVEDFVLPRFEVKIKPPSYVLATDKKFTFTVCANYTFGQPVKGNLSFIADNIQNIRCRAEVVRNVTISGCRDMELTSAEMKIIDCDVYQIAANAIVTEEGTGVQMRTYSRITITRSAVAFKTLYTDSYVKPNLPFTLKLRAVLPDHSPAAGVPIEVCAAGRCTNKTSAQDGIFTIILPPYDTNRIYVKSLNCRANMYESEFTTFPEHYYSPSNSSLLIHAPEGKLKCVPGIHQERILPVFFSATNQSSAHITVQVISRGKIQYCKTEEHQLIEGPLPISKEHLLEPLAPLPKNTIRGVVHVSMVLPSTASPDVKVLVWYTREDGEVVSDIRELEVEKCLNNDVSLSWSVAQAQPGAQASLFIYSEPNSVCSLGVVDRSSELLSRDPDPITLKKVFHFLDDFRLYPWHNTQYDTNNYCQEKKLKEDMKVAGQVALDSVIWPPQPPPYYYYDSAFVDALKMFDESGLYIFTDLTVETRPCERQDGLAAAPVRPPQSSVASEGAEGIHKQDEDDEDDEEGVSDALDAPRTNFPETWLWDLILLPSSGVSKHNLTLPDTITQWVGKAVCVHPRQGVGLSDRETITTFTPFFVDLTLPPTVKRGEILPVKISIFNYLNHPLPVTVVFQKSSEYNILDDFPRIGLPGLRASCVPAQNKVVPWVRIEPKVTGYVNITVKAFVDHKYPFDCGPSDTSIRRSDALIKPIKVEAEGFLREKTWTKYICSKDFQTGEDSLESWWLETPTDKVEGSERAWITAVGDLLALSLENLGYLIRMPYGCGEQNMVNFAPNIYIMQYLRASNQTTPESTKKLLNFMNTGYQRELLYRRDNGSYSAFGNADDSGSTWLTAFVLKSFAQAQEYITVDEEELTQTSDWLKARQRPDGCFTSLGKVLHKGLKGGIASSNSSIPLTAYVMISLLEAGEDPTSCFVCHAAHCLKADTSDDPYTLALKAYAFALARLPEAESVIQQLLDKSIITRNSMNWEMPSGPGKSKTIEIETAGYAILAMMTQDPKSFEHQARKVVKWITTQRNGQGGFYSTQDTVVALQAMAVYESHLYQGPLNVVATVTATGLTHPFTITDDNKLLQQLVTLPTLPTSVYLNMEGQGCAVLQAVLRYNIHEPEVSNAFYLGVTTVTVPDERCVTKRITVCTNYRLADGESNMAVIEVDLITGYVPMKEDLLKVVRDDVNIKKYEVDGSLVSFYIEELTNVDTCVDFRVTREVEMENVKAGKVIVYDYYQPELVVTKRYTLPPPIQCL